jgi:hypothetical protein
LTKKEVLNPESENEDTYENPKAKFEPGEEEEEHLFEYFDSHNDE